MLDRARQRPPRPARMTRIVGLGVLAAVSGAIAVVVLSTTDTSERVAAPHEPATRADVPGELGTAESAAFGDVVVEPGTAPRVIRFRDGSQMVAAPGVRLTSLESSESREVMLLERGRLELEVVPGGPRRWIVETGLARVEIVGTKLSITRGPRAVEVQVDRGVVLVWSALLDDGVRRLEAGDRAEITRAVAPASRDAGGVVRPRAPTGRRRAPVPERSLEVRAAEAVPDVATASSSPSVRTLDAVDAMTAADRARRRGRYDEAAASLVTVIEDDGRDTSERALAAFTLGRIELEHRDRPAGALDALERALELGLPSALERSALAYRIDALAGCGMNRAAREAAAAHLARFPDDPAALDLRERFRLP